MTRETALRRLEWRTEQLAWFVRTDAPQVIIENQRGMVAEARAWVDSPPECTAD